MKSGKLLKFSPNIFGGKWTEKWVHLDAHALRCYPMVVDQVFSLQGTRLSKVILLQDYTLSVVVPNAEKRWNKKYCFQLVDKNKEITKTFACTNEQELVEWVQAIQQSISPRVDVFVSEGDKRWKAAHAAFVKIGWSGNISEYSSLQQYLDPQMTGKISQVDFLDWVSSSDWDRTPEPQCEVAPFIVPKKKPASPAKPPPVATPRSDADWNTRYWDLLGSSELHASAKGLLVAQLVKEFRDAAEVLVCGIMDCKFNNGSSVIRDSSGSRCKWFGYDEKNTPGYDVYLGNGLACFLWRSPSVIVSKTIGHDLRSSRAVQQVIETHGISSLAVPLQCLVDYCGARAMVFGDFRSDPAIISIENSTTTVFTSKAIEVLKHLNLCPLSSEPNDVPSILQILPFETHLLCVDQSLFVWTRLRLLCSPDLLDEAGDDGLTLLKLRPEYIKQYHTPLSPNVYRGSNPHLDNAVACASHYLQKSVVPAIVARLEANEYFHVVDSNAFTRILHTDGINMRYLGRIYELASLRHVRRLVLTEMLARTAKVMLRGMLRNAELDERGAVVLDFFNLLFSPTNPESIAFFSNEVIPTLVVKFGLATPPERNEVHLPQLFMAMEYHTGVLFSLQNSGSIPSLETPFRLHHLIAIQPLTSLIITTTQACLNAVDSADNALADGQFEEALANVKLGLALEQAYPTYSGRVQWCHLLVCAAELMLELQDCQGADTFAQLAIEEGPVWHACLAKAHVVAMKLGHLKGDSQSVTQLLDRARDIVLWHLGPNHIYLFDIYMTAIDIWINRSEWQKALTCCDASLQVLKDTYGRKCIPYAEVRAKQAMIVHHLGNPDQALSMYEDCLEVYDTAFAHLLPCRAECCAAMANLLLEMNSNQAAYTMALKAHSLRKESCDENEMLVSWMLLGTCATALQEYFRAIEYFKSAWHWIKTQSLTPQHHLIEKMKEVTRELITLKIQVLTAEERQCFNKVVKHSGLEVSNEALEYTMGQIYAVQPCEYMDMIFEALVAETNGANESSLAAFSKHSAAEQLLAMYQLQDTSSC